MHQMCSMEDHSILFMPLEPVSIEEMVAEDDWAWDSKQMLVAAFRALFSAHTLLSFLWSTCWVCFFSLAYQAISTSVKPERKTWACTHEKLPITMDLHLCTSLENGLPISIKIRREPLLAFMNTSEGWLKLHSLLWKVWAVVLIISVFFRIFSGSSENNEVETLYETGFEGCMWTL